RDFAGRNAHRVERLFQILKQTAQPLGHPALAGAGIPDALRALNRPPPEQPWLRPYSAGGLEQMRDALRRAGLSGWGTAEPMLPQPRRGSAIVGDLPLSPPAPFGMGTPGFDTSLHGLRSALQRAGI